MVAVIERAVLDACSGGSLGSDNETAKGRCKDYRMEARQWIMAYDSDPNTPFTFRWLCDQLDVDHDKARKDLWALISANKGLDKVRRDYSKIEWLATSVYDYNPDQSDLYYQVSRINTKRSRDSRESSSLRAQTPLSKYLNC